MRSVGQSNLLVHRAPGGKKGATRMHRVPLVGTELSNNSVKDKNTSTYSLEPNHRKAVASMSIYYNPFTQLSMRC